MTFVHASDGVRLHYEAIGGRDKPVVLLIQGLGADKHGWDLQRWSLAGTHRTIAFDNRGVGRSDKPDGAYSLEQMAADAIAVLDHAGVEKAHVVGASMGGAISQIVAVKYPHRVRSLTLACTSCRNHTWRQELLSSWAGIAAEHGMGAMSAQAARWVIEPRSFRRVLPALGWLGPLGTRRAAHGFCRSGQCNLVRRRRRGQRVTQPQNAHACNRWESGYFDTAWRQRGTGGTHSERRAGGDFRCGTRFDDRTRPHV